MANGPAARDFDDRTWRRVDLPHDWAVGCPLIAQRRQPRLQDHPAGPSPRTASAGTGASRTSRQRLSRRIALELGRRLPRQRGLDQQPLHQREHSGYASTRYDITDYLHYGQKNVVAVRVDATGMEGWWYEGRRHLPPRLAQQRRRRCTWATGARSCAGRRLGHQGQPSRTCRIDRRHHRGERQQGPRALHPHPRGAGPRQPPVARRSPPDASLAAAAIKARPAPASTQAPRLWSLSTSQRYTLVTELRQGTRWWTEAPRPSASAASFDAHQGFFLNGQHVKLQGTNNHQDHAGVGVALPDALISGGCSGSRPWASTPSARPITPPRPSCWTRRPPRRAGHQRAPRHGHSPELRHELERPVRRDRNHPSVILWSVGNEEWAIPRTTSSARLAREIQAIVRRLDPTRGLTLAASSSSQP